ncbi:hypothetical protein HD554DRAFT_1621306 [Boletus coccyginus]|nr:hypothetical protein HD554DRAFT_1621306 [Boletus coccyginus]
MRRVVLDVFLCSYLLTGALAQTWCGKHYMSTQGPVAPGGNFLLPLPSSNPLLALRCAPAIRPYLAEDIYSPTAILIDTPVVHYGIANPEPIQLSSDDTVLKVTVSLDGRTLAAGVVPLNATGYELPFSLEGITPQKAAYDLSCEATYGSASQTFSATTVLSVLPNPTNSSVTKMDLRTGALLVKPATGAGGTYEPVFPIGFFTNVDGHLATNFSVIDELKEQGFTIIHPLPPSDNLTALDLVIDRMQEVGLYLMYEMRDYTNSTAVTEQVNIIKSRPNLLLWYTADEPDGQSPSRCDHDHL